MDALDLARWQFAITTVYHFLFVPITIGMSAVVAGFHTAWLRTRNPEWLRLAKFFGKLFTINFALGLVTGIVQEFQFGMNWSTYSRFVGDIFGAPLALEALLAFFLESTFLGLWIFGWGRIPERLHAACMWIVHVGTLLSAYFILAANSFMQNPVGYRFNPETQRAELVDFGALLTNNTALAAFPHAVAGSFLTAGTFVLGVACWSMVREARRAAQAGEGSHDARTSAHRPALLVGIVTVGHKGIEWMNRSARRMFGGDLSDFFNLPISTVATRDPQHPFRQTGFVQDMPEGQAHTFECQVKARDGRTFWVVGNAVATVGNTLGGVVMNVWDSELWNVSDWVRVK